MFVVSHILSIFVLELQQWNTMKQLFPFLLLLTFVVLACVPSHSDMNGKEARAIMDDVSRKNLAYELLTERDDTMMQQVVAYYKEHGTANDRMEAYYLLGSVYRDLHDAPKAVEAFLNGINAADTTSEDCRYDILTRLYAQKGDIFYLQELYEQALEADRIVQKYAMLAKDTLFMVASNWGKLDKCYAFSDYQTIVDECWYILEESRKMGMFSYAASRLCTSVLANMELGRVEDAQKLLSIYEEHSGLVNPYNHECSFPIYYYAKGRVLAATGQLDSAEYFYRKELEAQDWNNRQAAYRGLRMLFEQKGLTDSVCKYAPLQCDAVDSAYQEKLSLNLQNLQELYDNNRLQAENNQKELQLEEGRRKALCMWCVLAFVIVCGLFLFFYLRSWYRQRIAYAELKLERANAELEERENNLQSLRDELARVEDEKEKLRLAEEVEQAERDAEEQRKVVMNEQKELNELRRRARMDSKTQRSWYHTMPLFQSLLQKAEANKAATEQDYKLVEEALLEKDACLMQRFHTTMPVPSETERHIFLLLRFGMTKKETSLLIPCSKAAVTNCCTRLFHKVHGRNCSTSSEACEWLMKI